MQIVIKTNDMALQPKEPSIPEESEERKSSFLQLFRFADKTDALLMTVGSLGSVLMGISFPAFFFLTGDIVDSFSSGAQAFEQAKSNMFLYLILGAAALVMGLVMYFSWTITGERQAIKCREEYFRSIMKQEMAWFDLQDQGGISSKFEVDSMTFQLAVGQKISTILMVLSMLFGGIGLAFYLGWILSLVLLAYIPVIIIFWSGTIKAYVDSEAKQEVIFRESDSRTQEMIGAIKLVKQMNAEEFQLTEQDTILDKIKSALEAQTKSYLLSSFLAMISLNLIFPLAYWYGSQCVFNSSKCPQSISSRAYTAGSVLSILTTLLMPAISLNQLSPAIQKIAEGKAAANRIFSMIDRVPQIRSKPDAIVPRAFGGVIEFVNVSFAYPKEKDKVILKNLDMKIDCRHAAIIGPSGGGKSTIFQLIMRFYDPDQGTVFLDGNDLRDLDLDWLRSQIGYVTQEPTLFATSIKENILMSKIDASEGQLEEALKKAEAFGFVSRMKEGVDTFVGSGGGQLSGGQKQRIAIARVLIKKPKLLLMDEATSALDRNNEKLILKTLNQLGNQFYSLSITHRKRVLAQCEKVYRFEDGRILKVIENKNRISSPNLLVPKLEDERKEKQFELTENDHHLLDPSQNIEENSRAENNQEDVEKEKSEEEKSEMNEGPEVSIFRIFSYFLTDKCLFFFGVLFSLAQGLVFPTFGVLMAKIIVAELQYSTNPDYFGSQVQTYYLIALGLAIFGSITNVTALGLFAFLSKDSVKVLRMDAYRKIVNMPVEWFEDQKNSPEKITSEMTMACKHVYVFMKNFLPHLIFVSTTILYSLIGATYFEWRTGLTAFAFIPLIILSQAMQFSFVQGMAESKGKLYKNSGQTIKESVMNIRTVLSLSASTVQLRKYNNQLSEVINVIAGKALMSGFMYGLSSFTQFASFGLIFFLAAIYIRDFNLSIDGSMESIFLIMFAGVSAGNNAIYMSDISTGKSGAKTIFNIIDMEDEHEMRENSNSRMVKEPIQGDIQFIDVDFKYKSRENLALDKFNLKIRQGESIGLVGPSGCGKSTIFGLLQGFYVPTGGKILIDGVDINDFDLRHLRSSFGVVSQEPRLFNESIEWNIRYNLTDASSEDVVRAAIAANFDPRKQIVLKGQAESNEHTQSAHIIHRDDDLDSFQRKVGPRGSHVSGGQKQRIAIARALLRKPKIILLDEATSALDPESESKVQKSLEQVGRGRTTLCITHKTEQCQHFSKVVVIADGRVEDEGLYSDLLRMSGGALRVTNNLSDTHYR